MKHYSIRILEIEYIGCGTLYSYGYKDGEGCGDGEDLGFSNGNGSGSEGQFDGFNHGSGTRCGILTNHYPFYLIKY